MSDDIFIKHGLGAFQQPYIGRASVNAQEPVIAQRDARTPAGARQPGTYQHRSPGTYQLPASAQTPFIRNRQTPNIRAQQEPNIRSAQEPNIRDKQNPVIRDNQTPFTYQHRTPTIYQNSYQSQQPGTYQHQSPSISRSPRNYQVPFTYQHRSPSTQPVIAQRPVIYQHRSPAITTYRHPTSSVVQSTYQVTKQQQNPVIRNKQSPYIFSFRSPFIQAYQTPYSHQQPAIGTLTVGSVEGVARASELITAFGNGDGIPEDQNSLVLSGSNSEQAGAASILIEDSDEDINTDVTGRTFIDIRVLYTNTNDVAVEVKRGTGTAFGYIGDLSGTGSSTFGYSATNLDLNAFTQVFRKTNIGFNKAQVKINFPDPTASPYSISTSGSNSWSNSQIASNGGYAENLLPCLPRQWQRTTYASPFYTETSGSGSGYRRVYNQALSGFSSVLTTSYANLNTTQGHAVRLGIEAFGTASDDGTEQNPPTGTVNSPDQTSIFEIVIKDTDTNTEYTCDLMVVFANYTNAIAEEEEDEDGECPECCVHEDMLIATGEDMKSIHDIKIGDKVVSHNFTTGENELVEVEDLIIVERDVDYKVNDLIMTEDHPVYLNTGRKASVNPSATLTNYKQEVDELKEGDVMIRIDGSEEEITSIERHEGMHKNYAIKTKHNNFYANGILVDSVIQEKK